MDDYGLGDDEVCQALWMKWLVDAYNFDKFPMVVWDQVERHE
jgi:hypothetical protein